MPTRALGYLDDRRNTPRSRSRLPAVKESKDVGITRRRGFAFLLSSAADSPVSAVPSPFGRVRALHSHPFAPQRRHRNAEKTLLRRCFIPTSRDVWTIVETPLAGARGYQRSKTQRTLVSLVGGLRVPRFLCGGCSRLCGALSVGARSGAPRPSVCTAETTPERRKNPAASLFYTHVS